MNTLEHFTLVWCDTCDKTQPMIFDVMQANDKNDHDAYAKARSIILEWRKFHLRSLAAPCGRC
jgi:hypothetical protein